MTLSGVLIVGCIGAVVALWVVVAFGPTSHEFVVCPVCDERNPGTQPFCAECQTDLGVVLSQDGERW
ncbi:hypothetical protein [Halomarina rubra]|uniref:Zinc ribbon domain-containing protein n=1 Tax=Halomarina rubra TaxID=2071873 RepID=A0ABD6AXY4_9EURY|nr:hypothetical protein [Halomarina rubra]